MVTPTEPGGKAAAPSKPLVASDPKILDSVIGPNEVHLYESSDQHGNWLDCIKSRKAPIAPAEVGHRACSTCLLHHIAMKTNRKLYWDPAKGQFKNDDAANAMLLRPQRAPYRMDIEKPRMKPPVDRSNLRWVMCGLLFLATCINYMDRSALSLVEPILRHILGGDQDPAAYNRSYSNIVNCFIFAYGLGFL